MRRVAHARRSAAVPAARSECHQRHLRIRENRWPAPSKIRWRRRHSGSQAFGWTPEQIGRLTMGRCSRTCSPEIRLDHARRTFDGRSSTAARWRFGDGLVQPVQASQPPCGSRYPLRLLPLDADAARVAERAGHGSHQPCAIRAAARCGCIAGGRGPPGGATDAAAQRSRILP